TPREPRRHHADRRLRQRRLLFRERSFGPVPSAVLLLSKCSCISSSAGPAMIGRSQDVTVSLLGLQLTVDRQLSWSRELLALLKDVIAVSEAGSRPLRGSIRIQRGSMRAV